MTDIQYVLDWPRQIGWASWRGTRGEDRGKLFIDTQAFDYTAPPRRSGPEVRGGFLDVPIDLTNVPVGARTLTLVVDPLEDRFADFNRDNNSATIRLRVRERGGPAVGRRH